MFTRSGGYNPIPDISTTKMVRHPIDFFVLFSGDPLFNYNNVLSMRVKTVLDKGFWDFICDIFNYILWYINFQFNLVQVSSINYYIKLKWLILYSIIIIKLVKKLKNQNKLMVLPSNNYWYNENYIILY